MSEQGRKVPDAMVFVPGELWPDFKGWALSHNLVLTEALAGDSDTEILVLGRRPEKTD